MYITLMNIKRMDFDNISETQLGLKYQNCIETLNRKKKLSVGIVYGLQLYGHFSVREGYRFSEHCYVFFLVLSPLSTFFFIKDLSVNAVWDKHVNSFRNLNY